MDSTQNPPSRPPVPRAILVTILALGAADVGFACGILAGTAGSLSFFGAATLGATTFVTSLMSAIIVMKYVRGDD
ncbi:hypothetical protein ACFXD5_22380 [Streptomyces sp. NPDC059385]|uniref:hypothetical protein n=1 Tax=Streptomyces sp. NPDC059385 TaxID=3346817 RepID=UPI0036BAD830